MAPLLHDLISRFQQFDSRHQYQLVAPEMLLKARCDSKLTMRILENLLGNAMRYAVPGGVEIRLECASQGCRLIVEDEGPGVAASEATTIFERHRRGSAGRSGPPGLGIGLNLSRGLAVSQGGTLSVVPGSKGRFELWLPAAEESLA
jgi:two-component system sensor histidine kinase BaeS